MFSAAFDAQYPNTFTLAYFHVASPCLVIDQDNVTRLCDGACDLEADALIGARHERHWFGRRRHSVLGETEPSRVHYGPL